MTTEQRSLRSVYMLWEVLAEVPKVVEGDEAGTLQAKFMHFPPGTHQEAVWAWLESENPRFLASEAMAGVFRREDGELSTLREQQTMLGPAAVQALLRDRYEESVRLQSISYYESIEDLAEWARRSKYWSQGETFVHVLDKDRYVILCQIAPASCEMLTVSQNGYHNVLTACWYEQHELVGLLNQYVSPAAAGKAAEPSITAAAHNQERSASPEP